MNKNGIKRVLILWSIIIGFYVLSAIIGYCINNFGIDIVLPLLFFISFISLSVSAYQSVSKD